VYLFGCGTHQRGGNDNWVCAGLYRHNKEKYAAKISLLPKGRIFLKTRENYALCFGELVPSSLGIKGRRTVTFSKIT
jgi:hypothetical protein